MTTNVAFAYARVHYLDLVYAFQRLLTTRALPFVTIDFFNSRT